MAIHVKGKQKRQHRRGNTIPSNTKQYTTIWITNQGTTAQYPAIPITIQHYPGMVGNTSRWSPSGVFFLYPLTDIDYSELIQKKLKKKIKKNGIFLHFWEQKG